MSVWANGTCPEYRVLPGVGPRRQELYAPAQLGHIADLHEYTPRPGRR
jgi:hypothetical protein